MTSSVMEKNTLYLCRMKTEWENEKGEKQTSDIILLGYISDKDEWEFYGSEYGFECGKLFGGDTVRLTREMFDSDVYSIVKV